MTKISAYFNLIRPINTLITFFSVALGAAVTGVFTPLDHIISACLSAALIAAGANTINDYFDVEIDRINKPFRPLPAGIIPLSHALYFSVMLFAGGLIFSFKLGIIGILLAIGCTILLIEYSAKLKKNGFIGNLTVSVVAACTFIYGGIAVGRILLTLIPALFALLFHLGREIIKDTEDCHADIKVSAKTIPIKYSKQTAVKYVGLIYTILIILTLFPYLFGIYNIIYLLIVILGVDIFLVCVIISIYKNQTSLHLRKISALLKADMVVGMIAIFMGRY